jgi:hypothetical protein
MTQKAGPLAAAVILSLAACGGSKDGKPAPESATVTVSSPRAVTADSAHPQSDPCPRTGLWAQCSVEKRLSQSGFVVRRVPDSVKRRSGFSVIPIPYILGHSRLDVFVYPTTDAAARETSGLDTVLAGPRGARNQWGVGVQPTFVRSANLIAVFLTDNPTQSERLSLALTAGPPQP